MKKIVLGLAIASAIISCTNEYDNNLILNTNQIQAPDTYVFVRNGESTVSFSGQTDRIRMATELVSELKNTAKTEVELRAMFDHKTGSPDFIDGTLNASSKSVRGKVAASTDFFNANTTDQAAIRSDFDGFIAHQVNDVFPNWNANASAGFAGQLQESGGESTRYINEKGLEYNQAFAKGVIGALMVDQMLNNYLGTAVLDAGDNRANNDASILSGTKNYTSMEHKWDEAYGYLYGNEVNPAVPVLGADIFLNEYVSRVENDSDFSGISMEIYNAFKLGRQAIVKKNYTVRDAQAKIIKEKISEIIGIRAVYYLQQGKTKLATNKGSAFHALSEGYGFIYSLQFTRKPEVTEPYFTKTEVDAFITTLISGNGFWDITAAELDTMSDTISDKFNFTTAQAGS